MPLPSFPPIIFKASGKTSQFTLNDISTFPIPHQDLSRRVQSSDSLVAASDVSESSRCSMESSFEEEIFVGRGISTTKTDWQTSKERVTSPKGEDFKPTHDAGEDSSCESSCASDHAPKSLSESSDEDAVCPRLQLDPTNFFLKPVDDASEDPMTLSLRGGQLDIDDAGMIVEDTDSEVFEDDYTQGSRKNKFSQWLGASSSKAKSDKPRSIFGLGRLWKSSGREQSACFFDQEKEIKGSPYQDSSFATTTPTKLYSIEAMERMNASLPGLNLRCAHPKM